MEQEKLTPEQLMDESLADWMFDTIFEIGSVDEGTDPDEVTEVVMDFVWPEKAEYAMSAFEWMMEEYGVVVFFHPSDDPNRVDYAMIGNGTCRRFVGLIEE